MITSRQIIDIIRSEISKSKNEDATTALKKLQDRIEILEEIEYVNMNKSSFAVERKSEYKSKKDHLKEIEKVFK
jgi:hypothetical protein